MIQQQTTWAAVDEGDYVVGQGDVLWKVRQREGILLGRLVLENREGETKSLPQPPPTIPVVKMVPTPEEAAEHLIRSELGGRLMGTRATGEREWHVPELYDVGAAQRHLHQMHGIYANAVTDMTELMRLHDETAATVPHDHRRGLRA